MLREYICKNTKCNHKQEFIEKHSSRKKRICDKCKSLMEKIKISLGSFQLKGRWYKTGGY